MSVWLRTKAALWALCLRNCRCSTFADIKMSIAEPILYETETSDELVVLYPLVLNAIMTAADLLDLPERLRLILTQPKNELIVNFPVRMDDGSFRLFVGYRVQHNNVLGPYKGGIRWHPSVSLDHIRGLAALMTVKSALARFATLGR